MFEKGHTVKRTPRKAKAGFPSTPQRDAKIAKRVAEIKNDAQKKLYLRAVSGKSKPSAIKAFCIQCCGDVRTEVTGCTALGCELYPYRPYQNPVESTK